LLHEQTFAGSAPMSEIFNSGHWLTGYHLNRFHVETLLFNVDAKGV
jgi:hypothetical protein